MGVGVGVGVGVGLGGSPLPLTVIVAADGEPNTAPALGALSANEKDLVPLNGVLLRMFNVMFFVVASPTAQLSMPEAALYALPDSAVPSAVA